MRFDRVEPVEPLEQRRLHCQQLQESLLQHRQLIIAANRSPTTITTDEDGAVQFQRGGGGLVTALIGLVQNVEAVWIASASNDTERQWKSGIVPLAESESAINVEFITPDEKAYDWYYNTISNPLLWFLQHSMWDIISSPTIDQTTWQAWNEGYVQVNQEFGEAIANKIKSSQHRSLVFLQDYHLYLAPRFIRQAAGSRKKYALTHFIHIPWPGSEDWGILPPPMRQDILEGLCAVDLLGFQTREDSLNFIRTVESHLPNSHVNYRNGRVWYRNHITYVRDFPISIDVDALKTLAESEQVREYRQQFDELVQDFQVIVRIDRTEPSKNIVRGFQAFEELLALYPEHIGKVIFLAVLVPSRLKVEEYQNYLDDLMAAAGRVNARFGTSGWEPIRVLLGEDYPRAIAALQIYDVLLVNSIADGMNLVAKEGPVVNQRSGVVLLSERVGAQQQLEAGATIISPIDIYNTARAIHDALVLPMDERRKRADRLRCLVEEADVNDWFCQQLRVIAGLNL
ncbi:MAG TPA: trehalose-6-phosphate synthase [Anaerolineaceae bacterium]|nr:trehalose-6-phosphate synthase [Anaerolineaceae bacterium]